MAGSDSLKTYRAKRNFDITSEPAEGGEANADALSFVIQKHWATRLHYDFRLELDGSMKSWAVPKGPSYDSRDKRMAVHVEDHPISYNSFEGQIPEKQYGAGKVIIWDKGTWVPLSDPRKGYRDGNLKFELHGHKLHGKWVLVRMKNKGEKKEPWLLIKEKDTYTRPAAEYSVVDAMPDSVAKLGTASSSNGKTGGAEPATPKTPAKTAAENKTAGGLPGDAIKTALPDTFSPQLATLVSEPPADGDAWLYEIKFDGYRILSHIAGKKIRLITRNGNDWSGKLAALVQALVKLKLAPCWLDGEIVVANENGVPDFQALQNAFDTGATQQIVYYVFDLPFYDGHDLRSAPLIARRALLKSLLKKTPSELIHYSETFDAPAGETLASACRLGLEGVIGKRKHAAYVSHRSNDWIKLKCTQRQEFVIGGYTAPKGSRQGIGSLLLGVHDNQGNLLYAGKVGTGFSDATLVNLSARLEALKSGRNPFSSETDIDRKAHWVSPVLVAEVSFGAWTHAGKIRHAVFHGLRTDKQAKAITREQALSKKTTPPSAGESATVAQAKPELPGSLPKNFKVSHGDRIVDPSTGATKIELIRFYALIAPLMMPHLKGRPASLVRAPDGIDGQLFFQKHMKHTPEGVSLLNPALDPEHASLMEITKPIGLLAAAQMNVIEFHTWNSVKSAINKPDRMTFDLDPGEGVSWEIVRESTLLMRSFLEQLGLKSFVKTSGGKGMHVIVPLKKRYDCDTIKDFSHAIVDHMARTLPMRFAAKSGPKNRVGKIFIDYLRNGFGATTVAAWSLRSRPGLSVSVPIAWAEVASLQSSAQWNISNIHTRLDRGNAPWDDYDQSAQNVTDAMKILGFAPAK